MSVRRLLVVVLLPVLGGAVLLRAGYWWVRLLAIPRRSYDRTLKDFDVICFSHVAWSHVWQRNHHTMSRLAQNRTVVYFQTSNVAYLHRFLLEWPRSWVEFRNSDPRVRLVYPLLLPGQSRFTVISKLNDWLVATQVRWLEHTENLRNVVGWYYYPETSGMLNYFQPSAVVYDIQDEYGAFAWSSQNIRDKEAFLLQHADVVFAGTRTLFEEKTQAARTKRIAFYPCGVEFDHFHRGAPGSDGLPEPELLKYRGRPRLAYAGLIDKRIDGDLLLYLAKSHPEWQIIMIGPVDGQLFDQRKIERAASNIFFSGQVDYRHLPEWLAHCELYIMPWEVNDLTRHINPTKTLEYAAAGRPIVSIALPDLENLFSDCVNLAKTPSEFVTECEQALAGSRQDKVKLGLVRAGSMAWESVVGDMAKQVTSVLVERYGEQYLTAADADRLFVYRSVGGSHWDEIRQHRVMEKMGANERFWFLLGHWLLLPFAVAVLILTAAALPLYWLWDKFRRPVAFPHPNVERLVSLGSKVDLTTKPELPGEVPQVSVIIPFYNRVQWVDRVIRSVLAQKFDEPVSYEIIAVDNGSTDGTFEKLQTYPIQVVRCMKRGPGAARNAGAAVAQAAILAFTDSDCVVDCHWLNNLLRAFRVPDTILAGGEIVSMTRDGFTATFSERDHVLDNQRFFKGSAWFPRFFATANLACRRDAFAAVGGFDTTLWMSEDADLCWRLLNLGGTMVYVGEPGTRSRVYHQHRETLMGLFRQSMDYGSASTAIFAKHRNALGGRRAINWQNIKHLARTPYTVARNLASGQTTFEKTCELHYALWRLGFAVGCIKTGLQKRVLFI